MIGGAEPQRWGRNVAIIQASKKNAPHR